MTSMKKSFSDRLKVAANQIKQQSKKGSKLAAKELQSGLQKLSDKRMVVGVTGLSQSGKSTFITSLINQLMKHDKAALAGFDIVREGRLLWTRMLPLDDDLPEYPYDEAYQAIASEQPSWPPSTSRATGCLLELRIQQSKQAFDFLLPDEYSFFIEIRDYPGEWLLDLPMMSMSYSRWCGQCSAQFNKEPRSAIFADLLPKLKQIDPLSPYEPGQKEAVHNDGHHLERDPITALHNQFRQKLFECRQGERSLSLIQPGRFLIPGDIDIPCFIPLLNCGSYTEGQLESAPESSYYKHNKRAYDEYVARVIKPFYKQFFSKIDRQVILVDVVNALNSGPEYLEDMRHAMSNIIDSFHYGEQNKLKQLFSPKIDKVIYAATKIDQVIASEHESVKTLLSGIVQQAIAYAQYQGVKPNCEAVAAIRASEEKVYKNQQSIVGCQTNGEAIGYIHPTIPHRIPEGDAWQTYLDWELPKLSPPKGLSLTNQDPIPHIRMDKVLQLLLGDKCR
jgi:uncharacterized protein